MKKDHKEIPKKLLNAIEEEKNLDANEYLDLDAFLEDDAKWQ